MYRLIIVFIALVLLQSSPAWSDEAADMKIVALGACEKSKRLMTVSEKRQTIAKCKCIVEKTDYSVVIAGDETKIKEENEKNTFTCALKSAM